MNSFPCCAAALLYNVGVGWGGGRCAVLLSLTCFFRSHSSMSLYTSPKLGVDSEVFADLTLKVRPEIWQRAFDHVSSRTKRPRQPRHRRAIIFFGCSPHYQSVVHTSAGTICIWTKQSGWMSSITLRTITTSYCAVRSALLYIAITKQIKSNDKINQSERPEQRESTFDSSLCFMGNRLIKG